jgi:hypothetical protein
MSKVDGHKSSLRNAGKIRLAERCQEFLAGLNVRLNDLDKMKEQDGKLPAEEQTDAETWAARVAAVENTQMDYNGKMLNRAEVSAMLSDLKGQLKANGVTL